MAARISALPLLQTRKALLVLDLQNDFVSSDGALPVTLPEGFVLRCVQLAQAFRDSGTGEVIWVRSQFEASRSVENVQTYTQNTSIPSTSRPSSAIRGRRGNSKPLDGQPEGDAVEAFLSLGNQRQCVLPDTVGSELAPSVAAVVGPSRDTVLTKTHYSAFETKQLLMRLRKRFVTELYICGALANISIYATALDAGRNGMAITIVGDCCGYRSETRHTNTMQKLTQLIGCDIVLADDVIDTLAPKLAAPSKSPREVGRAVTCKTGGSISAVDSGTRGRACLPPYTCIHAVDGDCGTPRTCLGTTCAAQAAATFGTERHTTQLPRPLVDSSSATKTANSSNDYEVTPLDSSSLPSNHSPPLSDLEVDSRYESTSPQSSDPLMATSLTTSKPSVEDLKKRLLGAIIASASRSRQTSPQALCEQVPMASASLQKPAPKTTSKPPDGPEPPSPKKATSDAKSLDGTFQCSEGFLGKVPAKSGLPAPQADSHLNPTTTKHLRR